MTERNKSLAAEVVQQLKWDKQKLQKALFLSLIVNLILAVVVALK